jgi:hypothetical protein
MKHKEQQNIESSAAYKAAWESAQAGGMNNSDSHEFALDQASRPAVSIPVADAHKEARAILVEALCHHPQHDESCWGEQFAKLNRSLPPSHPAWKSAPACNCWVARLAAWLKNDNNSVC